MNELRQPFPTRPARGHPVNLSEPLAHPGRMNPVSVQSIGCLLILLALAVLGFSLFLYDAGSEGVVSLDKLNLRLCWTVVGTGLGLSGLLLLLLSRLEVIAQATRSPSPSR